jgi:hypothetical protein
MSLEVDLSEHEHTLLSEPGDDDEFLDLEELEDTPGMVLFDNHALHRQIEELTRKLKDRDNEVQAILDERDHRHRQALAVERDHVHQLETVLEAAQDELAAARASNAKLLASKAMPKRKIVEHAAVFERRAMRAHMGIRFLLDHISKPIARHVDAANIIMNLRKAVEEEPEPTFNPPLDPDVHPGTHLLKMFDLEDKSSVTVPTGPTSVFESVGEELEKNEDLTDDEVSFLERVKKRFAQGRE